VSVSARPCDVFSTSAQLLSHQHRQIEVWPSAPPPRSIFGRQHHHVFLVLSLDSSPPCSNGSAASAVTRPQTTPQRANRGRHHQRRTTQASTTTSAAMSTKKTPSRPSGLRAHHALPEHTARRGRNGGKDTLRPGFYPPATTSWRRGAPHSLSTHKTTSRTAHGSNYLLCRRGSETSGPMIQSTCTNAPSQSCTTRTTSLSPTGTPQRCPGPDGGVRKPP
jgi:hypothetical protein